MGQLPLYICLKFNNQNNDTMKKVNTKTQALEAVISMLTLEQMNGLPFGDEHDSRYEARKKIIEALEILENID